ncbi:MAG: GNAT family N-acetyltransferase [Prevotellaceae bacterium]|jgi:ribosomal protein S18 acetylase RimI-like enzyme|nr:GNAT family N-acetyltransferase [Prevotellaceae bacterium]
MNNFQIRFCTADDYALVFELLKQLWTDVQLNYETLQTVYENALKSDRQKLIIGLIDNKIIGFCSLTVKNSLWQSGNLGHIDELVVDENFRKYGIGKKLMDAITKIAKENNCKQTELSSAFHRKEAHQFYENLGYEKRAYLFSKVLDDI